MSYPEPSYFLMQISNHFLNKIIPFFIIYKLRMNENQFLIYLDIRLSYHYIHYKRKYKTEYLPTIFIDRLQKPTEILSILLIESDAVKYRYYAYLFSLHPNNTIMTFHSYIRHKKIPEPCCMIFSVVLYAPVSITLKI